MLFPCTGSSEAKAQCSGNYYITDQFIYSRSVYKFSYSLNRSFRKCHLMKSQIRVSVLSPRLRGFYIQHSYCRNNVNTGSQPRQCWILSSGAVLKSSSIIRLNRGPYCMLHSTCQGHFIIMNHYPSIYLQVLRRHNTAKWPLRVTMYCLQ